MLVIVFLTMFNFWWLSYWLEQGSGVSVRVGVWCIAVGSCGVGGFLHLRAIECK